MSGWEQVLLPQVRVSVPERVPQQVLARVRVQVRELAWSQVWLEAWLAGWVIWARKTDEIAPGRFDGHTYNAYAWLRRGIVINPSSFFCIQVVGLLFGQRHCLMARPGH